MRTVLLVMLLLFPIITVMSQNRTPQEIELEINRAVSAGNYTLAAQLKKEKQLREEIKAAVNTGDYEKAAQLKKELESGTSTSTDSSTIKPEFINQVYLYDDSSKALTKLEKREAEIKTSVAAAPFYASSTSYYFVSNNNSPVEIKAESSFVVETSSGIDPSDVFKMAKFDPDKRGNDRYLPYSSFTSAGYGGASSAELNNNDVPISFSKISDNIYKIKPSYDLQNGEYAFIHGTKFFCFRVGPIPYSNNSAPTTTSKSNNGIPEVIRSGIFMSALLGPATGGTTLYTEDFYGTNLNYTSLSGFYIGYKAGNKIYFGSNEKFRSGIKLTWIRIGAYVTTDAAIYIQTAPIGLGYTAVFAFTEEMALEAGMNLGPNFLMLPEAELTYVGLMFSPEVKFRYKKYSAGLEYFYSGLTEISSDLDGSNGALYSSNTYFGTFNISIGIDF